MEGYPPIAEHGLIGDLQTAALVTTDGTVDWWCCPRFDSPSVFASLLDHDNGGQFRIGPEGDDYVARQLYFPDTAILITRFMTPDGVGEVTDFLPLGRRTGPDLCPDHGARLEPQAARVHPARPDRGPGCLAADDAPVVGFVAPTDPLWLSTLDAMDGELVSDSLVYRYDPSASPDGLRGHEGTFSICTFWYVDALARSGRLEQARLTFEKMFTYANHLARGAVPDGRGSAERSGGSMKEPAIVASVLGADYARLGHEVAELEAAGVDRIQWYVMDGRFVPNLTFGADVVGACRSHTRVPFEAHLMVEDPDQWLQAFAAAGCDTVLVHAEACRHLHRTLSRIGELGVRSGVALNPATPLECVRHVLDQVDVLLVMTVNPGFGGQAYLESMEGKVVEARRLITQSGLQTLLEVDGGISAATAPRAWKAGAELLVAGSAILAHPEGRRAAVADLRRSLRPGVQAPSEERAVP